MDNGVVPVLELLHVHVCAAAHKETPLGGHHGVFQDICKEFVNVKLRVFADRHVTEADGRTLFGEHHIQDNGVQAVVVVAILAVLGVVLGGIQQVITHELDVVEDGFAVGGLDFVIPVHHNGLVAGVHGIVVEVLFHIHGVALGLALQLRVFLIQEIFVHQLHNEQVAAVLDIGNAGCPEQFQQVDFLHVHVAQSVFLVLVPEHAVGSGTVFQLLPPVVGVCLLIVVVLQQHRQDGGKHFRAFFVGFLPGQHHGFREVVHSVGVLIQDGVKQPGRGWLRASCGLVASIDRESVFAVGSAGAVFTIADGLPVAQLPPKFVLHNTAFQVGLAVLVGFQDFRSSADLLHANYLLAVPAGEQHSSHFRRHSALAGNNAGCAGDTPGRCGRVLSEDTCHFS